MRSVRSIEIAALAGVLLIGGLLFVWMIVLEDTIPVEYRSASPGFGWSWDFDYDAAIKDAGRLGEKPLPWPALAAGNRLVLPLNQTLLFRGLEITYRGMPESGSFQLDVVIQSLDAGYTYQKKFSVVEAKSGFKIADRRFILEKISSRDLRLRSATQ